VEKFLKMRMKICRESALWRKPNSLVTVGNAFRSSGELVAMFALNSSPSWDPRDDQCRLISVKKEGGTD